AVTGDPARRPDPAALSARAPADDVAGIPQADPDNPAAVVPAIAKMPAKRDIDASIEDGQRAALVLVARVEALAPRRKRFCDINRPTRQWRAVLQRRANTR